MADKIHTFSISHESETEGVTLTGVFTSRRLSMMDRSKINVRKAQLNGGMYCVRDDEGRPTGQGIDEETDFFNYMLAYLEVCLVQKPSWWKLTELADRDVVMKVFEEAMKFENSFRKRVGGSESSGTGSVQSGEGSGQAERKAAVAGGAPKKVVESEVQDSLDG